MQVDSIAMTASDTFISVFAITIDQLLWNCPKCIFERSQSKSKRLLKKVKVIIPTPSQSCKLTFKPQAVEFCTNLQKTDHPLAQLYRPHSQSHYTTIDYEQLLAGRFLSNKIVI